MIGVLLILWDTKYFGPLHTACTTHNRYLRVLILLNAQSFRDSILAILHAESEKTKITTKAVHALMSTSLHYCFFSFCFPLSELGTFLSVSFEWHAGARYRSHSVQILLMSIFPFVIFLFFPPFFLSFIFYVRIDGGTL